MLAKPKAFSSRSSANRASTVVPIISYNDSVVSVGLVAIRGSGQCGRQQSKAKEWRCQESEDTQTFVIATTTIMKMTNGSRIHVDIRETKSERLTFKTIKSNPQQPTKHALTVTVETPGEPHLALDKQVWPSPQGPGRCCAPPAWLDLTAQAAPNVRRRLGRFVPGDGIVTRRGSN